MARGVASSKRSGLGLLLGLIAVLAARLLTPAGFMPAIVDGKAVMIECPAAAPSMPGMDHHGGKTGKTGKTGASSCPFGIAGGAGILPSLAIAKAPAMVAAPLTRARVAAFALQRRLHAWPPSIGPPIHA